MGGGAGRWWRLILLLAPVLVVAGPFLLRPEPPPPATRELVVITPHGEATRSEFGDAFAAWARRELKIDVKLDWRTPGGTSDIVKFLDGQYAVAVRAGLSASFPASALGDFARDPVRRDGEADAAFAARQAVREAFLASDLGCGIDLLWGGGEFPHRQQAEKGYLVDAGLLRSDPDWFAEPVIPREVAGERFYDPRGRYYGVCLSTFGICASRDRIAGLADTRLPAAWSDLGEARFQGGVVMADPTKSGAAVKVLETILQREMARALAAGAAEAEAPAIGWQAGWGLLRRIAANARLVTDGASKAVREVARGDAVAGMCIDFHARAEAEASLAAAGTDRLAFCEPEAGTAVSADPIALLRGAPNRDLAVAFIRFCLSTDGQRLWNRRVGVDGGPRRWALRRLPIRRDLYTAAEDPFRSDPGVDPVRAASGFRYRAAWTGPLFSLIAPMAKALLLDPREELETAWRAICAAGGPAAVPAAWEAFSRLPVPYGEAAAALRVLNDRNDPLAGVRLLRAWTVAAQAQYREAARLAGEGR